MQFLCLFIPMLICAQSIEKETFSENTRDFDVCISKDEMDLYNLINDYRKKKRLPEIPLSKSLTYIAKQHCIDLIENTPDKSNRCNPHSWSDKGKWTDCCYTADHKQANCMWDKPKELTNYQGKGFEIAVKVFSSDNTIPNITPTYALEGWQESSAHNALLINKDIWKNAEWNSIGIGIYKSYAIAWFGMESDEAGAPGECQ